MSIHIKFEPRDVWVGAFWDRRRDGFHLYVCPLPLLVIHWHRKRKGCGTCVACYPDWFGMYLCATCGNKRCPHATDCRYQCTGSNEPGQAGSIHFGRPAAHPGEQTDKSLPELLGLTEEAAREFFGKWPEPDRCEATLGAVRCGLDARHVHGGPKSHCANPSRGGGSTSTGPGFVQWRDEPP